jgi:hypothetical protein
MGRWPAREGNQQTIRPLRRRHKAKSQVHWVNQSRGDETRVSRRRRADTQQGPAAAGGEVDYVVNGKMIGGFALVAYPAEYRNSGVMTFIVNHAGTVFQKDLGPNTARIAERMTSFNPDETWQAITDTDPLR